MIDQSAAIERSWPGHRGEPGPPAAWRSAARLGAGLLLALCITACSLLDPQPEILDGLSIGNDAGCGACDTAQTSASCGACEPIAVLARRHIDEMWPGHGTIASLSFHSESWYPGPSGEMILHARSGGIVIALVTFADGSRHAVSVYCGVGGCM